MFDKPFFAQGIGVIELIVSVVGLARMAYEEVYS
jgi:hypothetical protein